MTTLSLATRANRAFDTWPVLAVVLLPAGFALALLTLG